MSSVMFLKVKGLLGSCRLIFQDSCVKQKETALQKKNGL